MALTTTSRIIEYTGAKPSDFQINGLDMEESQFVGFLEAIIPKVTQMIHRHCNVYSFEPLTFTEYHSGRGAQNYDDNFTDYNVEDTIFFLNQLYVGDSSFAVYVDTADKSTVPSWCRRYPRPTAPLAEVDTLTVLNMPTTSGNITITLNNLTSYTVALTAGMTIAQVCAAILAAGAHTDSSGVTWTPTSTSPYVTLTAGGVGTAKLATISVGTTGLSAYFTQTTAGTSQYAGDYEVYQQNDVTRVQFYNNIPAYGTNNIKFTYNTGYAEDSVQLNDIRFQCLRACKNVLVQKKKIQEAFSIRAYGVRDYSQMFDVFSEDSILDQKVTTALDQYRRFVVPAQFAYD